MTNNETLIAELEKLENLRNAGALSEEEFQKCKAKLLAEAPAPPSLSTHRTDGSGLPPSQSSSAARKFVAVTSAAAILLALCSFYVYSTLNKGPSLESTWNLENSGNALDGTVVRASKTFMIQEHDSRIDVLLTCAIAEKTLKLEIDSYHATKNEKDFYPANRFIATPEQSQGFRLVPNGRIKLGTSNTISLSNRFMLRDYNNVIVWQVEEGGLPLEGGIQLPIIVELENETGTVQVAIPADSQEINSVIHQCENPVEGTQTTTVVQPPSLVIGPSPPTPQTTDVPQPHAATESESNPASQSSPSETSCAETLGAQAATRLEHQCEMILSPTHPACGARNSCQVITDSIAYGCDQKAESANGVAPGFCMGRTGKAISFISPSFDCMFASTWAETMICADQNVASLDVKLANAYRAAEANSSDKAGLAAQQSRWLAQREDCWSKIPTTVSLRLIRSAFLKLSRQSRARCDIDFESDSLCFKRNVTSSACIPGGWAATIGAIARWKFRNVK